LVGLSSVIDAATPAFGSGWPAVRSICPLKFYKTGISTNAKNPAVGETAACTGSGLLYFHILIYLKN